jgi:hypothetical protein
MGAKNIEKLLSLLSRVVLPFLINVAKNPKIISGILPKGNYFY